MYKAFYVAESQVSLFSRVYDNVRRSNKSQILFIYYLKLKEKNGEILNRWQIILQSASPSFLRSDSRKRFRRENTPTSPSPSKSQRQEQIFIKLIARLIFYTLTSWFDMFLVIVKMKFSIISPHGIPFCYKLFLLIRFLLLSILNYWI